MSKPEARIFPIETRFQQMAKRPGGIPRDKALDLAEAAVEQLKPEFDSWLRTELRSLTQAIGRLSSPGALSLDQFSEALVHCLAIHDVGATMGCQMVSFVTGGLKDILQASLEGAEYRHNRVECFMEALGLATQEPYRALAPGDLPDLAQGLRALAAYASPPPPIVRPKVLPN